MTLTLTPRFRFAIPDFLSSPWHADWSALVNDIDRILYSILTTDGVSVWANSHVFLVGDLATDPDEGQIWQCLIAHTSVIAGTFSDDRIAHPTYWGPFAWSTDTLGIAPTYVVETVDNIVVSADNNFLILNKAAPAPTTVQLGPVVARGGFPLTLVDWAGNAGDIVFTPAIGETIEGNANYTIGSGGKTTLYPVATLSGWVVGVG